MMRRHIRAILAVSFLQIGLQGSFFAASLDQASELDRSTATSVTPPDYPYEARRSGITGSGIILLEVEPATGEVKKASMAASTGSAILDRAALDAFRRWRFKPGTNRLIKVPITFTVAGNVRTEYAVKKKPIDEALARFLGKGTVIKGPIPEYPRSLPWTNKSGRGVYEMHVQKDGRVSKVRIIKRSGDDTFDRVTLSTLRNWRLRRGPLILELPLSFTLTPTKYSVDIPKNR